MKNQRYQVVIEDAYVNLQALKLFELLGFSIVKKDTEFGEYGQFILKNGALIFRHDDLQITSTEIDHVIDNYKKTFRSIRKQPLAKSVGIKNIQENKLILDLTSGVGNDLLLLKAFGANVLGVERSEICTALLMFGAISSSGDDLPIIVKEDSLNFLSFLKGVDSGNSSGIIFNQGCKDKVIRLSSYKESLNSLLSEGEPQVIYLDPMYDEINKKTLPRKEMQVLRNVLPKGTPEDTERLFYHSFEIVKDRVVMKRSMKAKVKFSDHFSHSIIGKSTRYDVYLKRT